MQPKKNSPGYLRGWFLVAAKGDVKQAKKMAQEYTARQSCNETKQNRD